MFDSVQITRATVADAPAIWALQQAAYQQEARLYDDFTIAPLTETLATLQGHFARLIFLKAVCAGVIVGSVRAAAEDDACAIGRLIVHPAHQRRGIGTALMHAIEAAFPHTARFTLFTGDRSIGNLRLYARLGYTPYATETVSPALTLVHLEKVCEGQTPIEPIR